MTRTLLVASILAVAACGGSSKDRSTLGGDPCGGDPCGAEGGASFAGWDQWVKVNDARFVSKGHRKAWVDVYVEADLVDTYRAATGPYPVGARLVKAQYGSQDGDDIQAITVMEKRPDGYDDENGNWYYGVFDPSGTEAKAEGKINKCINCHGQAEDRDWVFGPQ